MMQYRQRTIRKCRCRLRRQDRRELEKVQNSVGDPDVGRTAQEVQNQKESVKE